MKRKPLSVERRQARAGWIFALPWLIGLVYFFIVPFVQSVWYSFNDVKIATDQQGLAYTFAGLENYKYMLLKELLAKATINNCRAGRAAKGANPTTQAK